MFENIVGIIGLLLGILGIYIAIIAIRKKRPLYVIRNINLINKTQKLNKPLKILYNDNIIDNIIITNIVFWNAGNDTISSQDLPENSKLCFLIGQDSVIIDSNIIKQSIDSNGTIMCSPQKNRLNINFDYYDSKQGFILQIFHTEQNFEKISLQGIFKGAASLKKTESNFDKSITSIVFSFVLTGYCISYFTLRFFENLSIFKIFTFSAAIIFLFYLLFRATKEIISIIRDGIPKSLAEFRKL